jgi:hypothetical protein
VEEIKTFLKDMDAELSSLYKQLGVARNDATVMEKILNMTECSDGTSPAALMQTKFLQCFNTQTGRQYTKIEFKTETLRRQFAQMQHPGVLKLLREAGIEVNEDSVQPARTLSLAQTSMACGCSCHNDSAYQVLLGNKQNNNSCQIEDANFHFLDNCCIKPGETKSTHVVAPCCPIQQTFQYGVKVNSVDSVFSNAEKNQGKPATKMQSAKRPKLKNFIFISLTNQEFFNQNPTKLIFVKI